MIYAKTNTFLTRRRAGGGEGSKFISAATADGYSGGSATCADESFNALQAIPALGFAEAEAYFDLADASSYTGGSLFCSEKSFESLISIA